MPGLNPVRILWIRWNDGVIRLCIGSFEDAKEIGESRGLPYVII